jgi:hypothetical protein
VSEINDTRDWCGVKAMTHVIMTHKNIPGIFLSTFWKFTTHFLFFFLSTNTTITMKLIKTSLVAFLSLFICSLFFTHATVGLPEGKLLHVPVPENLGDGYYVKPTKRALYVYLASWTNVIPTTWLYEYVVKPNKSTLELVDGVPDNTTWSYIFDILQTEHDGRISDVIFGIRADSGDKLSVQIDGVFLPPLFDHALNAQVFACLIPGTSYYAIVHLHNEEAWLYTNWNNRSRVLELKVESINGFKYMKYIKASHDSLFISLNRIYELKLEDLPNIDKSTIELKPSSPKIKDAFYLSQFKLHFNQVTLAINLEETASIGSRFCHNDIDKGTFYFLTLSNPFMTPLEFPRIHSIISFVPKEGVKDSITKSTFSLPTAKSSLIDEISYPFVCWLTAQDPM